MSRTLDIQLCKSCLKDCGHKPNKFRKALRKMLRALLPGAEITVEKTSCLKICPRDNIGLSLKLDDGEDIHRAVRTMARSPDLQGTLDEVMSLVKK